MELELEDEELEELEDEWDELDEEEDDEDVVVDTCDPQLDPLKTA